MLKRVFVKKMLSRAVLVSLACLILVTSVFAAVVAKSGLAAFDLSKHTLVTANVHIGEAGYLFKVNDKDIKVSKLGVPSLKGAVKSRVNLYEVKAVLPDVGATIPASKLSLKATAIVTVDAKTKDKLGFNYATLSNAVILTKGKTYLIQMESSKASYAMLYYPNGANNVKTDVSDSAISIISPSFSAGGKTNANLVKDGADTVYDLAQPGRTFGTPNLIYTQVSK